MTSAVQDRCKLGADDAAELTYLKTYLQVDHSEDNTIIADCWAAAKSKADETLNNRFNKVWNERLGRGDGSQDTFNFVQAPDDMSEVIYVDGKEIHYDNYTIDTDSDPATITFNTPPEARTVITASYEANLPIPKAIKDWCLRYAARIYEYRIAGLKSMGESGLGQVTLELEPIEPILPYRQVGGF